jgi:hypothetical protein
MTSVSDREPAGNFRPREVLEATGQSAYESLNLLQQQLQSIYKVAVPHAVSDFITTDLQFVSMLTRGDKDHVREKLLIYQAGQDIELSLYLHPEVVNTMMEQAAGAHLDAEHFGNLCLAIEGISHFLYLTWRAMQQQNVSLLELELQAEVDKYVLILLLIRRQKKFELINRLPDILFENIKYDEELDDAELVRYREANNYAARYCGLLATRYLRDFGDRRMIDELRRFYRLGQHAKLRRIDNGDRPQFF